MEARPACRLDPALRERNLAELTRSMPALADRVRCCDTLGWTPVLSRDGRPTLLLRAESGGHQWLGRTSIPSVRAAALLEQFQAGTGNVLLPGIGQGAEVALLLQRLGPHRAVFVWEPSDHAIDRVLRIYDWQRNLAAGRLILLGGPLEHLADQLVHWLDAREGVLCPQRIMMWPWQALADLVPIRAAVESAFQRTEQRRAACVEELMNRLRTTTANSGHTAVISSRVRPDLCLTAHRLAAAEPNVSAVVVESPGDMHPLARLRRLTAEDAAWPRHACLVELLRQEASDILPGHVPATCWLGLRQRDGADALDRIDPAQWDATGPGAGETTLAVTGSWLYERVCAAGVPRDRVSVVPPAHLATEGAAPDDDAARPIELIIAGDAAPLEPAALGFTLPTHAMIWNHAVKRLTETADRFTDDQASRLLHLAEQDAANRLADNDVRRAMMTTLTLEAASTLFWIRALEHLTRSLPDLTWRIIGQGWAGRFPSERLVPSDSTEHRERLYRTSRMFLHASPVGAASADCLTATACGAVLLARRHPRDRMPGGLGVLLDPKREYVPFETLADLVAAVSNLRTDAARRTSISAAGSRACRSTHGPGARLTALKLS